MAINHRSKQFRTSAKKPKKAVKTGKSTRPTKKRAPKLPQVVPETPQAVPNQAENAPKSGDSVPGVPTYRQLLSALPDQRARFVEEYLIDLNPTAAAIRANYSAHTATKQSSRLLTFVDVREAVEAGKAEISEANKDRFEEAMEELKMVAFSDIQHYITVDELTGAIQCKGFEDMPLNASRAIESVQEDRVIRETQDGKSILINDKRRFKLHGKVQALIAYIDRLKPPVQKIELTGSLTNFPPKPKTMKEWEALVKAGKI